MKSSRATVLNCQRYANKYLTKCRFISLWATENFQWSKVFLMFLSLLAILIFWSWFFWFAFPAPFQDDVSVSPPSNSVCILCSLVNAWHLFFFFHVTLSCLGKLSVIYSTLLMSQEGAEVQAPVPCLALLGALALCWGSAAPIQPGSVIYILGCLMA